METNKVKYKNSFHNPHYQGSEEFIETDAEPVEYRGYLIYHRYVSYNPGTGRDIFDIMKDGVCIGMYAGPNGARRQIDKLLTGGSNGNSNAQ